jgi:copper(I)-binding protein
MGTRHLAFALLFGLMSCSRPSTVEIEDVWARDTIGRTANAAVFMTIRSATPDRLVGASTPIAQRTDLMTFAGGNGAMEMEYLAKIDIPAGKPVSLDPTGLHVWLSRLKEPLRAGQTFPLSLKFQNAGERRVMVSVIAPTDSPPA